jgi:type I restriction enzyme S subunit
MVLSEIRRVPIRDIALVNANSIKSISTPAKIQYIDISSVGTGEFTEPPKVMSYADAPSRARRIVKAGDTILSMVRPNRRSFLFLAAPSSIAVASTGFAVLTPTPNVDARYLYYWVTRQEFTDYLSLHAKGAAYPAVSAEDIGNGEIDLPHLPIQQRIAGILSAYDELIENSQQRIKILESMARALYREWFVHFRFPGHESVPRVPTTLGDIPQGWEVCELGDFVQFKSGFAFKSGTFTEEGNHRLVTIKNVQDGAFNPESDSRMSDLPPNLPPFCVLNDGDILLSLTGNVGRVCLVYDGPFLLNQRVCKLSPVAPLDWAMTYCMFREPEMRTKLEMLSNGVAQQNLSPVLASHMKFVLPPRELRQSFQLTAEPMVRTIIQLYTKIKNLRQTRDLLLPRLLSGQFDVETIS